MYNFDSNFHKNKNSKKTSINVYNSDYKWERTAWKDWDSGYRYKYNLIEIGRKRQGEVSF